MFFDDCYFDLWAVRPVGDRDFNSPQLFHFEKKEDAKEFLKIVEKSIAPIKVESTTSKVEENKVKNKRLVTVSQLPELYPSFTIGGIRHLIFFEKENGFSSCIRRVGRKILIDCEKFEQWVDNQK